MEVVHDDRRTDGQLGGVVRDRRGEVSRHSAVYREQISGFGTEPWGQAPGSLDEAGPEAHRVGVGPVA
jgi:hypothetical protein